MADTIKEMQDKFPMMHNLFAEPDNSRDVYTRPDAGPFFYPWDYTGWQDETLSWKESCYIHPFLSGGIACLPVKGPEALKLLDENFINNFNNFEIGTAKHIVACAPTGNITCHGMCLRTGEDSFDTYSLDPTIPMLIASGKYDVEKYEPQYNNDFIFQFAGPRSLELVENCMQEDVHDLKFMRFRYGTVAGRKVRVIRMGMGGTLAYEFHGALEDALPVYDEVMRVGEAFDLKRLGYLSYQCNHTENGFPQWGIHFTGAWEEDPDLINYMSGGDDDFAERLVGGEPDLAGSMKEFGNAAGHSNPIEVGWSHLIDWDSDFKGKEALEKFNADPDHRTIVTLEWNSEDILKVFAAYFDEEKEVPDQMMFPQDVSFKSGNRADKVLGDEGEFIGKSNGFLYTLYYKKVISQAELIAPYAQEGREVTVIWGTSGTRQIPIRATVARYPYLDLVDNRNFDIESVPHYQA